jgi:hypothetical protein
MEENVNHKVFISYSHDNEGHKNWVMKLATDLRNHGVDAILDQFELRLGDDLPYFMEQGLSTSHIVLCICSDNYIKKANEGTKGTGYEKRILAAELLNDSNSNFIIPIIKNNHTTNKLPYFLSSLLYIDFDKGEYYSCYRELLERIYGEDLKKKPALGSCPFVGSSISDKISTNLNLGRSKFYNPNMNGLVSFDYKRNNGIFTIGAADFIFSTKWSECSSQSIYCYNDNIKRIGYNPTIIEFPNQNDFDKFDYSSREWSIKIGEIVMLENNLQKFAALKVLRIVTKSSDINHLLEFEYKIYDMII